MQLLKLRPTALSFPGHDVPADALVGWCASASDDVVGGRGGPVLTVDVW
ncbi:hypothetical protein [Jonesia denitrificans]|nr:hypothetical protein [Jonesia denitrificans]QXB42689.1 hypothetical protein I6L70_09115 [Jonesia denitrificans]